MELVEYCDKRFLDACDIGRGRVLRRAGGEVISGGSGGCAVVAGGEEMAGGEVAGEEPGDMMAVMVESFGKRRQNWGRTHPARMTIDVKPSPSSA